MNCPKKCCVELSQVAYLFIFRWTIFKKMQLYRRTCRKTPYASPVVQGEYVRALCNRTFHFIVFSLFPSCMPTPNRLDIHSAARMTPKATEGANQTPISQKWCQKKRHRNCPVARGPHPAALVTECRQWRRLGRRRSL